MNAANIPLVVEFILKRRIDVQNELEDSESLFTPEEFQEQIEVFHSFTIYVRSRITIFEKNFHEKGIISRQFSTNLIGLKYQYITVGSIRGCSSVDSPTPLTASAHSADSQSTTRSFQMLCLSSSSP